MKKIAFFDIDGTMINVPNNIIHPTSETMRVLNEFKQQKNYIVVATARGSVPSSIQDIDFDGYIFNDGHYIIFNNQVWINDIFTKDEIAKQMAAYKKYDGKSMFGGHELSWCACPDDPMVTNHREMFSGTSARPANLIEKFDEITKESHSQKLMPIIENAFKKTNLTIDDIDLIVCDIGPGSFTGIRIGVATVKAFCDSKDITPIGISSLEALAYSIKNNSNIICSIINAKNDNCYFALYEKNKDNTLQTLIEPEAENIDTTLSIINSYNLDTLNNQVISFVGDGSKVYKDKILEVFPNVIIADNKNDILDSYNLGLAGFDKYSSGEEIEELLPLYLKKPQAQIQLEKKDISK